MSSKTKNYLQFAEPIYKLYIEEIIYINGSKIEYMIINDEWKLIPTGNSEEPFKRLKLYV